MQNINRFTKRVVSESDTAKWQKTILTTFAKERSLIVPRGKPALQADVTHSGAVLLGENTACDAFELRRPIRVVTHAHADHMTGLQRNMKQRHTIVMTPATKDIIDVIKSPQFLRKGNIKAIDYDQQLTCDDERLTLFQVDHILGAAQVLVEDANGTRMIYTGDFRIAKTPVIQSDILVIEATYGSPWRTRKFEQEVEDKLVSLVKRGLKQGPVYVFGYHGKLQEVMQILHMAKIEVPFIMPEKILQISKVHQKHGVDINRPLFLPKHEVQTTLLRDERYVAFYHMSWRKKAGLDKVRICVSGWEFNSPCRQIDEKEFVVALSDHSDFQGLLKYVEKSNPKIVITDNFRAGDAEGLARQITKRLGIKAKPLPSTCARVR